MSLVVLASDLVGIPGGPLGVGIAGNNIAMMRFRSPSTLAGFQVKFYGQASGTPPALEVAVYSDDGQGTPSLPKAPIESKSVTGITTAQGWQGPVAFASTLAAGTYYWLVFSCAVAASPSQYVVGLNNFVYSPDWLAVETDTPPTQTSIGRVSYGSVLELFDSSGNPVLVVPAYQNTPGSNQIVSQSFLAPAGLSFNVVWLFTQDRAWDETPLGLNVVGPGGVVLASGTLTMEGEHGTGTDAWIPVVLNQTVTLQAGSTYRLVETTSGATVSQNTFILGAIPISSGFQGQQWYFAFQLAQGDLLDRFYDYGSLHQSEILSPTQFEAARFKTSAATTLSEVDVRIWSVSTPGTLTAQLYTDSGGNPNTSVPASPVAGATGSVSVSGSGWHDISLPSVPLSAGTYYWIVLSSTGSMLATRLVNPHAFKVAQWYPSTKVWDTPEQGPTDIGLRVVTAAGEYRAMLDVLNYAASSASAWYAQSFTAAESSDVSGVAMELESAASAGDGPYSDCFVGLYSDAGGKPGAALASGKVLQQAIGLEALVPCQFSSAASIVVGTRYWIVVHGIQGHTRVFLRNQRVGFEADGAGAGGEQALASSNSGGAWSQPVAGRTTYMEYAVFGPINAPPPQPTPTTLTLTAKAL